MTETVHPLTGPWVVGLAGLCCGVLDLLCALAFNRARGISPGRTLKAIASGLLGPVAMEGGDAVAALGTALHFLIALSAAAAFYGWSRETAFLIQHAVVAGILYGAGVHLFMTFVVLPLSRLQRPFSRTAFVGQLIIHMVVVGPSISLTVRHFS